MNSNRTTATRLETKHASQVVLEPLLPFGAIATFRTSGHPQSAAPFNPNLASRGNSLDLRPSSLPLTYDL